jgi:YesN/AraC family two-component response regulator
MESHSFWQGDLCIQGSAEIRFPKYTLTLKPYDILIIPPRMPHVFCYSPTELFCCYSFKFDLCADITEKHWISKLISGKADEHIRKTSIECLAKIFHTVFPEKYWNQSLAFATSQEWPYIILLENMLYGILCNFYFNSQENISEKSLLIRKIREYIIFRDGSPVTLKELADHFGYTPGYLSSLILHETGTRAKFFIDSERIAIAQRFLQYSNLRIKELAELMGFNDINYFRKFYKRITGESPSQYKKKII